MSFSSFLCDSAGEHDDGNGHGGVIFFQGFQNIRTADLGQHHVEQDDVGQFLFGDLQGFFAVGGGADQVAGFGQGVLGGHPEKLAVLDQQHFGIRDRHTILWGAHRPGGGKL
jgi:hypothetical protein